MIRHLLAALALCGAAQPAAAFWEYGHETVAAIAWANVKPATRVRVRRLLAREALMRTPECPAATIEQASVWADCVKPLKDAAGKPRFGYAYTWHFQDVGVCRPYDPTGACKDGNCVSAQIVRDVAILRGRTASARARVEALLFLVHFVGDLHQPLHAGERDDQGGNAEPAAWGSYRAPGFKLHQVWDGTLAERALSQAPTLVRRYPRAAVRAAQAGDVAAWSRESWDVARTVVYPAATGGDACAPMPNPVRFDEPVIARLVPVMRDQVRKGGLRLAKLLDAAFA